MTATPPLSLRPGCDRATITSALAILDSFLLTVGDIYQALESITSLELVQEITKGALVKFLETYKDMADKINDPVNEYQDPQHILGRSVDEVETLLSLHDDLV